jgi:hypothetical protein
MLLDYLHFSRKTAQFYHLFNLCQSLLGKEHDLSESSMTAIELLNRRRIDVQKNMGELNSRLSHVCRECNDIDTGCCKDAVEYYFTAIDFWLRRESSNPIAEYALLPPHSCIYFVRRRVSQIKTKVKKDRDTTKTDNGERCIHLTASGCKLHIHDRPVKCLISTCPKLRRAMDPHTKREYRRSIMEMYHLSLELFDLMKKEACVPRSYGRTALFFTP